ncbi:bifunctional 3'-5' exonuclease/ATP-dependent helicase WRN-like [Clytia hemisphaerica]|uniref:DNA 3'-5' helicase n=1 Tax=Clytia hemisphaerica TaxID=252671 RepID=A0A7M5UIL0_9CNID
MAFVSVVSCLDSIFENSNIKLKAKQVEAISNIYYGRDTLCVFPTAFGKSLIYQCLPKLFKSMDDSLYDNPTVIVLSPLVALITSQVYEAGKLDYLGLNACALDLKEHSRIVDGKFNLIFGTPESWLNNSKWRDFVSSNFMVNNLACIVVDEVHKVSWGESTKGSKAFRETFSRIGELRSTCRQNVPVLALSATIDLDLTQLVIGSCNLSKSLKIISTCSDRPNIFLEVIKVPKQENVECLHWILSILAKDVHESPKFVIFCKFVDTAGIVYQQLRRFKKKARPDLNPKDLIGIFHAETRKKKKNIVLESLTEVVSLKVIVATSSLGCGVNMKDVRYIIHYGPAFHLVDYCQQVGRAGRDGSSKCHAILYSFPHHAHVSRSMKKFVTQKTSASDQPYIHPLMKTAKKWNH